MSIVLMRGSQPAEAPPSDGRSTSLKDYRDGTRTLDYGLDRSVRLWPDPVLGERSCLGER
jgi:hypothetical protein